MGQLAVAGGGAAVGAIAGSIIPGVGTLLGAQIGWAAGGIAGALLFPPKGEDVTGPRLNDLSVQTSGYGVPIPLVAGLAKLSGNVIYCDERFTETAHTRRQGKGGGGQRTTTYTYSCSWAVGLCEWLIPPTNAQVLRIWLDTYLVYDVTGSSPTTQVPGLVWRFHAGGEDQLPDPYIVSVKGSDAPAHRGLAYIVFEAVPLDQFGNRIPNVTVEINADAERTFPEVVGQAPAQPLFATAPAAGGSSYWPMNIAVDHARGRIYEGRDGTIGAPGGANSLIRVYDLLTMQAIGEYPMDEIVAPVFPAGVTPGTNTARPIYLHLGADGFLYCFGGSSGGLPVWKIDPDGMRAISWWGPRTGLGHGQKDDRISFPVGMTSLQIPVLGDKPRTFLVVQCYRSACLTIDADNTTGSPMTYVWGSVDNSHSPPPINNGFSFVIPDYQTILVAGEQGIDGTDLWYVSDWQEILPLRIQIMQVRYTAGAIDLGGGNAAGVNVTDHGYVDIRAEVDPSASRINIQSAWWDDSDGTLVITYAGARSFDGRSRFSTFKWSPSAGVVWAIVGHAGDRYSDGRGAMGRVLGATWGTVGNILLQTGSGDLLVNAAPAGEFQPLYWLDEQQAVLGWKNPTSGSQGTGTLAKRYINRLAAQALTDGDIVEALCLRAGLEHSDINVSALTDSIRGYMLARPSSARDAIAVLASKSQFDGAEVDDVLMFRKRGGATVATIPYEDAVREDPSGTSFEEQRAQDADLPQSLAVRYADVERGWEQNAQSWRRPAAPVAVTGANASAAIDLPIPLNAAEAKAIARRLITAAWRERTKVSLSLGPKYGRLVPTDPILLTARDGAQMRCRLLTTQLGANWMTRVEAVTEDAASYALTAPADGGSGWMEPVMPAPYYSRLILPDLPLLTDGDDMGGAGLREYAYAGAYDGQAFRGVEVYRSMDRLVWDILGPLVREAVWGAVTAAPGAPRSPWTWDETNTVDVRLNDGEIDSATALEVCNGANLAAMVGPDGSAEVFAFRDATQVDANLYRLSGLVRGMRGTEDQCGARSAGDLFLLLDDARLGFSALTSEQSATRFLRGKTIFDTVETVASTWTKSTRGRAEKPYAPVWITGVRDGGQNLAISWVPRTRVGGEWLDGTETVPVGEVSEAYEVDVLDGAGAVVRTIDGLTSPAASYPAADQVSDFGAAQAAVALRVYKISAAVGRGIPGEATV